MKKQTKTILEIALGFVATAGISMGIYFLTKKKGVNNKKFNFGNHNKLGSGVGINRGGNTFIAGSNGTSFRIGYLQQHNHSVNLSSPRPPYTEKYKGLSAVISGTGTSLDGQAVNIKSQWKDSAGNLGAFFINKSWTNPNGQDNFHTDKNGQQAYITIK